MLATLARLLPSALLDRWLDLREAELAFRQAALAETRRQTAEAFTAVFDLGVTQGREQELLAARGAP